MSLLGIRFVAVSIAVTAWACRQSFAQETKSLVPSHNGRAALTSIQPPEQYPGTFPVYYHVLIAYTSNVLKGAKTHDNIKFIVDKEIAELNLALHQACWVRELADAGVTQPRLHVTPILLVDAFEPTVDHFCSGIDFDNSPDSYFAAQDYVDFIRNPADGTFDQLNWEQEVFCVDAVVLLKTPLRFNSDPKNCPFSRDDFQALYDQYGHTSIDCVPLSINGVLPLPYSVVNFGRWQGQELMVNDNQLNDYTLAHEIGHSFGLGHETAAVQDHAPCAQYARGWKWTEKDGALTQTLMHRLADPSAAKRVMRFSDPNRIAYEDTNKQKIYEGHPSDADAARYLREVMHSVSARRTGVKSVNTVLQITSPRQATAVVGQPFTYQIATTPDISGMPQHWVGIRDALPIGLSFDPATKTISGVVHWLHQPMMVNIGATNNGDVALFNLELTVVESKNCATSATLQMNRALRLINPAQFLGDHDILSSLRTFRDEVLRESPLGRQVIEVYYQHGPELSQIVTDNRIIATETLTLVQEVLPALKAAIDNGGKVMLTARQMRKVERQLSSIRDRASDGLGEDLDEVVRQVQAGVLKDGRVAIEWK